MKVPSARSLHLVLASMVALLLLAGCGGGGKAASTRAATAPAPESGPTGVTAAAERPLRLGITEANPAFVRPGEAPPGFGPWRDGLAAIRPDFVRVFVDWSKLQPAPDQPADLAQEQDGCARGVSPCAPFAGVRAQLEAIKAAQDAAGGGYEVVLVLFGAPDWAAQPAQGCERDAASPRARPYNDAGLAGYGRLIGDLRALGKQVGVRLGWWVPYNEANQPAFVSPQRLRCDGPSRAPEVYARIVRAAAGALRGSGAKLVLGELAGFSRPTPIGTGVREFITALPDDVACQAAVWSQHEYASPRDAGATPPLARDAVAEAEAALDERPCTRGISLWVTETGVGGGRAGTPRPTGARELAAQCAGMAVRLERWAADPRVQAAFQYTLRDDPVFPVGWADPSLQVRYPAYGLWKAWADARGAAPPRPAGCGAT